MRCAYGFFQLQGLLMDWNCVLHDSNYTRVIYIESLQNYIWNKLVTIYELIYTNLLMIESNQFGFSNEL